MNRHDNKYGRTPLLEACFMNRKNVVIELIKSKRLQIGKFEVAIYNSSGTMVQTR